MKNPTYSVNTWPSDELLWKSFQKGSRPAFEHMYQNNIGHLINYGFKITNDRDVIQDCTQDLFIELWESRENLSKVTSIKYYLLKSLKYKIVRYLKRNDNVIFDETILEAGDKGAWIQSFDDELSSPPTQQLSVAINKLPKRQQEAIHLRYFLEMSNEEVAGIMGVNYQSACKLIYTALKTLRELMNLSSLLPSIWALINFL